MPISNDTKPRVDGVVRRWRTRQGLSLAQFAMQLNQGMETPITRAAVHQWEKGKTEPRMEYLLEMTRVYAGWQREMAIDCLCAAYPQYFQRDANGDLQTLQGE